MPKPVISVLTALAISSLGLAKDTPKQSLTVRTASHVSQVNERTSTYTTPGTSNTNRYGTGTTIDSTTTATTNCQTTSTPAQTHQITTRSVDVMNVVIAEGMQYTIVCRANWVGSNCAPMIDGDTYFPLKSMVLRCGSLGIRAAIKASKFEQNTESLTSGQFKRQ